MIAALMIAALVSACVAGGPQPVVSYTTPADGTGGFAVAAPITVEFNKPMDGSSITTASFVVSNGAAPIAGTVSSSGATATFRPAASLPYNTTLTAEITTAVKDASGNALAANHTWTFSTQQTVSNVVLHYTYIFPTGGAFSRSVGPVTFMNGANVLSQAANPDGSITMTISNAASGEENGFYFIVGPLKDFNSLAVTSSAGSFSANIYLDSNNDGDFFTWSPPNVYAGLGGDQYFVGPGVSSGTLTITSTSLFGGYTLAQLKSGSAPGVSGSTIAGIWIGYDLGSGSQTTTITSIVQQ